MVVPASIELVSFLLDLTLKSLLLAGCTWGALAITRTSDANIRHRAWTMMLLAMLALPLLTLTLPRLPAPVWLPNVTASNKVVVASRAPMESEASAPRSGVARQTAANVPAHANLTMPEISEPTTPLAEDVRAGIPPVAQMPDAPERSFAWSKLFVAIYLGVAAMLTGRLLLALALARRLVRRSRPLAAEPRMLLLKNVDSAPAFESADVQVPVTVGVRRAAILLPHDWTTWSDETLRLVMAHETIHAKRRDALIAVAANLNAALYWFNPLAWLLRRELATLAEQVCDDEVLREHRDRQAYAETLLTMASRLAGGGRVCTPFVAMARREQVEERIDAIIDESRPLARRLGIRRATALGVIAAPLIALAAMLGPASAIPPAEPAAVAATAPDKTPEQQAHPSPAKEKAPEQTAELKEAPPDKPQRVAGRVVNDADGQPVAGATVRLSGWNASRTNFDTKKTLSDAEGKFAFDAIPPGKLQIMALYGEMASRSKLYRGLKVEAGDETIQLRMIPAPSLLVKVVDSKTQAPVADAKVRLTWCDCDRDHLTNAHGEVTIRGLTPESWTLEVLAEGYAEGNEAIKLQRAEATPVTIELDPGFEMAGTVVDEQQQPLAGVGISVFPGEFRGQQIEYLKTDDQGKYRFPNLPLSGLVVDLSKTGYSDQRLDMAPLVAAGEVQEHNFTLAKRPDGGSIAGTVVDDAGKPLAGVKITNSGKSSRDLREATTDATGHYQLDDVFVGSQGHVAVFKSPGFSPGIIEFTPGTREAPAAVDVTLAPGHRLAGRVVDEQGQPLAGVWVEQGGNFSFLGRDGGSSVLTDIDGRFEFDALPADALFGLRKNGFSPISGEALPLDGNEEVVVAMKSAGVVRGRVVDAATGKSIKTFVVRITFSPDRTEDDPGTTLMGPATNGDGETFVSNAGEFELNDFTRGMALQVTVEAAGYERQVMRRIIAKPAKVAEAVEFSLKPIAMDQVKTYAGKVVDDAGKGIAGVEVRLIVSDRSRDGRQDNRFPFDWQMIRNGRLADQADVKQFLTAVTDAQGMFEFRDVLAARDVELAYWRAGVSQRRLGGAKNPFDADQKVTTFNATPTGMVSGKIDQKAFPRVDGVALQSGDESFPSGVYDDDKSFAIRNVPPGKYELQVYRYQPINANQPGSVLMSEVIHRQPVEVESGETTAVNLSRPNAK